MEIITTPRLELRLANLNDASFYLKLLNTEKWLQYIGDRKVYTVKEAENYIKQKMLPQHHRLGYGNYTIIKKSDNTKIGSCGLYDREGINGLDIGFAFLPENEGKGYAFEAAKELKEVAFSKFGISKIAAITTINNVASQKLLKKLGLKFVKMTTIPNDNEKLMLFEIEKNS